MITTVALSLAFVATGATAPGRQLPDPVLTPVFILSATALSPVSVRLTWPSVPGATRFVLSRNGQEIASGPNLLTHADTALRPNTTYEYTITANVPLSKLKPMPPPSARLTVTTPKVVSPQGVIAQIAGPGKVKLSWNPVPGITSYVISRNGSTFRVTSADFTGVHVDNGLPPDTYTYSIRSLARASDGSEYLGDPSADVTILARPFNVVAIGDSVMWGQGLAPASKFVTAVQASLRTILEKEVRLFLLAHSGAEVGPFTNGQEAVRLPGEVPSSFPSVLHQALVLAPSAVNPRNVDLVLMNGCINDVTVQTILNPTTAEDKIISLTREACGVRMLDRLRRVRAVYPTAAIVVVGYFPIVSEESDLTAVAALAITVGAITLPVAQSLGIPIDPVTGTILGVITTQGLKLKFASNSTTFFARSTNELRQAVMDFTGSGGGPARFVELPFGSSNAYAAPDAWLWLVPTPPLVKDDVYDERRQACGSIPNVSATCVPASMGHPNAKGARAYAAAINGALANYLGDWRLRHAPVQFVR